ncbi:universal stress protein [Streptomyces sp. SLBN-115]|uniref:universal stress protein n=1 Tax=Streptomyces sp. SLBN-115 TaxID=2768453 RepID=UPI00114E2E9A|nr:universal stress protein [Streptomyces sp. SLBN-115]TQJ56900.1 nucleotide-binding universal stress UspA family protein [Streptomyces sp. SLBN-115]
MTRSVPPLARRIVVGVDGSASAKRALAWAHFMARTTGSVLEVVTAWQNPVSWTGVADDWDPVVEARAMLRACCAEVLGDGQPPDLRLTVLEGPATVALLSAGAGARMLVLGSRGHGGFAGLLLGSVSAACAEHAACPTLIVHGDDPPPGATPALLPEIHGVHHPDDAGCRAVSPAGRPTRKPAEGGAR